MRCPRSPARSGPTQEVCGCAGRRPRVACGLRFGDTWAMVQRRHHRSQLLHPQASRSPSALPTRRSPRWTTTSPSTNPATTPTATLAAAPAPTLARAPTHTASAAASLKTNVEARPAPAPMFSLGLYEVLVLAMLLAAVCYVLTVYVLTVARHCSLVLLS